MNLKKSLISLFKKTDLARDKDKIFPAICLLSFFGLVFFPANPAVGQTISPVLNYQGRVNIQENGQDVAYKGAVGYFKFAVINFNGTKTYWSNDDSSLKGSEPESAVPVSFPRGDGVFSVSLGSGKMEPLDADNFSDPNTFLRVWFSSDNTTFDELKPNERFSIVPYAFRAQMADAISAGSLEPGQLSNKFVGMTLVSNDPNDDRLKGLGFARYGMIASQPWLDVNTDQSPPPLTGHTAVAGKTGQTISSMYVWGGTPGKGFYSRQGWDYDAAGDFWSLIPFSDAPTGRIGHTAIWAEDRMIIWGGTGESGHLSDGGIYIPSSKSWVNIPSPRVQIFSPRKGHVAVWTGKEMLVWGGRNEFNQMNDGAAYNPSTDKWRQLSAEHDLGLRSGHTAVWTGNEMLIWGGEGKDGKFGDGAAYNPESNEWRQLNSDGRPTSRSGHTAVWSGTEMLIFGGQAEGGTSGNGYAYNPQEDTWRALPISGGPGYREDHTATWTGVEMVVFGGLTLGGEANTGYAFNPKKNKWRSLTTVGGPLKRSRHTAIWTGADLVIFGGLRDGVPLSAPQRFSLQETWYLYRKL